MCLQAQAWNGGAGSRRSHLHGKGTRASKMDNLVQASAELAVIEQEMAHRGDEDRAHGLVRSI